MKSIFLLTKYNLIKQVRSYPFLVVLTLSIFLGFLCVPSAKNGYEIFYLGGVRGIYNSAWLGTLGAVLSTILLWLPGFYLLRSQVSEDNRFKIGQIIASTPMSKTRYVTGKAISNFVILAVLELLFLAALMGMQLLRQESTDIAVWQYIQPFLFLTVPYLMILSALTVLFDVAPGIKGTFGNIAAFIIWIILLTISVAVPENPFDLFGIGTVLSGMVQGARKHYPNISAESGSFGYYPLEKASPTFVWDGMVWSKGFLLSRLIWIGVAILFVILAALFFNRFRENAKNTLPVIKPKRSRLKAAPAIHGMESAITLMPVSKEKHVNMLWLTKGEMKMMLSRMSIWWYLAVVSGIAISPFLPVGDHLKWLSLIMLLPISVWSQMGCREKYAFTRQLVLSSCSTHHKWWASWSAGVLVTLMVSTGIIARFIMLFEWSHLAAWLLGTVFVPTLALVLGELSGTRKLFEAIYIVGFYFGPVNDIWKFDFWGLSSIHTTFYFKITCILLVIGMLICFVKERRYEKFIL